MTICTGTCLLNLLRCSSPPISMAAWSSTDEDRRHIFLADILGLCRRPGENLLLTRSRSASRQYRVAVLGFVLDRPGGFCFHDVFADPPRRAFAPQTSPT